MPAPGTKRVEVDGRSVYLKTDDAKVEERLREACALKAELDLKIARLTQLKLELVALARDRRGDQQTVKLSALTGERAEVRWRKRVAVDPARAEGLREALGDAWGQVFQTRSTYTLSEGYERFMATTQLPHLSTCKAAIAEAIRVDDKSPAVHLHPIDQ